MKRITGKINSQEGGLPNLLVLLMRVGLPLMKNVLKLLAKNVLLLLSVTAAALATDTAIPKKIMDSHDYFDIISNEEMKGT